MQHYIHIIDMTVYRDNKTICIQQIKNAIQKESQNWGYTKDELIIKRHYNRSHLFNYTLPQLQKDKNHSYIFVIDEINTLLFLSFLNIRIDAVISYIDIYIPFEIEFAYYYIPSLNVSELINQIVHYNL